MVSAQPKIWYQAKIWYHSRIRQIPRDEVRCRSPSPQIFAPLVSHQPPVPPSGLPLPQLILPGRSSAPVTCCFPFPMFLSAIRCGCWLDAGVDSTWRCAVWFLRWCLVQREVPSPLLSALLLVVSSPPSAGTLTPFPHSCHPLSCRENSDDGGAPAAAARPSPPSPMRRGPRLRPGCNDPPFRREGEAMLPLPRICQRD